MQARTCRFNDPFCTRQLTVEPLFISTCTRRKTYRTKCLFPYLITLRGFAFRDMEMLPTGHPDAWTDPTGPPLSRVCYTLHARARPHAESHLLSWLCSIHRRDNRCTSVPPRPPCAAASPRQESRLLPWLRSIRRRDAHATADLCAAASSMSRRRPPCSR